MPEEAGKFPVPISISGIGIANYITKRHYLSQTRGCIGTCPCQYICFVYPGIFFRSNVLFSPQEPTVCARWTAHTHTHGADQDRRSSNDVRSKIPEAYDSANGGPSIARHTEDGWVNVLFIVYSDLLTGGSWIAYLLMGGSWGGGWFVGHEPPPHLCGWED